jgi:spore coat protein U-like protein
LRALRARNKTALGLASLVQEEAMQRLRSAFVGGFATAFQVLGVFGGVGLGAVAIIALSAPRAGAVTTTATMQVTANVQATCTVSTGNLAFGNYTGGSASPVDATTTITATCPPGQSYTIGLNAGLGPAATTSTRKMTISGPGTSTLNYGLFTDSTHATNWDDIGGTNTVAGTGNGAGQSITAYGRIPAGQNVQTGLYEDTITVTMDY